MLIALFLAVAAIAGILTGSWVADRSKSSKDLIRLDENVGLGKRTGLVGDIELAIAQTNLSVRSGQPVNLSLRLTNSGDRPAVLNKWFKPAPAEFRSNQLPFKISVTRAGATVPYRGTMALLPPHTGGDFTTVGPGQSLDVPISLDGRVWGTALPGAYTVEVWYETYLTGKYIGVQAWTGMTNHVVAQVSVTP